MANAVVQLAYEEARAALREQDATLGNLRNRATGLLAATVVGTSISAAVGLLNTDPTRGQMFPGWAGWTLLALVGLLGGGVMGSCGRPRAGNSDRPPPGFCREQQDIDTIRRHATQAMINAITSNGRSLDRRMAVYRGTVCVLMLELLVLLAALIFGRR